jgi:hypothetical protein
MKKALLIFFCAFLVIFGFGPSDLQALGGHGDINGTHGTFYIPDGATGCSICHDTSFPGLPTVPTGTNQWMWVLQTIDATSVGGGTYGPINFSTFIPDDPLNPVGHLVDGNGGGVCEVCHTKTKFYTNSGMGTGWPGGVGQHYPKFEVGAWIGWDCTECHWHFRSGNRGVENLWFEPGLIGGQSHRTHFDDPKGPMLDVNYSYWTPSYPWIDESCDVCHDPVDRHLFRDGEPKATTNVCDECHSTGGEYGGADYAKAAWTDVVWCAHCHDDVPPSKVASTIYGVTASQVMGDDTTWGYNETGHGRPDIEAEFGRKVLCADCHDLTLTHTDKEIRTYSKVQDNYKLGYRLAFDMNIPRSTQPAGTCTQSEFQLCMSCHDFDDLLSYHFYDTNFREDGKLGLPQNYHWLHICYYASATQPWDSDWNMVQDSAMSCPACHNVHGSPSAVMIRHGELISTPLKNKIPALNHQWLDINQIPVTPADNFLDSFYGRQHGSGPDPGQMEVNYVCMGCHEGDPWIIYYRKPAEVIVEDVWTNKSKYSPGDTIRYYVRFRIEGEDDVTYFVRAKGRAWDLTSDTWETLLNRLADLGTGTHQFRWIETVPLTAPTPSTGKVRITIKLRYVSGGYVIDEDFDDALFAIE